MACSAPPVTMCFFLKRSAGESEGESGEGEEEEGWAAAVERGEVALYGHASYPYVEVLQKTFSCTAFAAVAAASWGRDEGEREEELGAAVDLYENRLSFAALAAALAAAALAAVTALSRGEAARCWGAGFPAVRR